MADFDAQVAWIERVLKIRFPSPPGPASTAPPPPGDAMAGWTAARATALQSLKLLENAFRAMKEPESDPAIILLRAIQANLTPLPATAAQVAELVTYITTDEIINSAEQPNGFGFKVELRRPLLTALQRLQTQPEPVSGARG